MVASREGSRSMPSRWTWDVDGPLDRRATHRRLAWWLDSDHKAKSKAWSWTETSTGIEIGLLDDALVERLLAGAGEAVTQVETVLWENMRRSASRRAWVVEFVSPVTFRRGNRLYPWPSPSAVLGSLRASWREFAAPHIGDITLDLQHDPVVVTAISGASEVERFVLHERPDSSGKKVPVMVTAGGFRGRVTYAVDGGCDPDTIESLMTLMPFAGIGAHTTRGFGGGRLIRSV